VKPLPLLVFSVFISFIPFLPSSPFEKSEGDDFQRRRF